MTQDLRATVLETLSDVAPEIDTASVDPMVELREQFDLDSMDMLNFVIGLHERLGVDIPEADYPQLGTLEGAVRYLQRQMAATQRAG
jgi:acyl carrier protein